MDEEVHQMFETEDVTKPYLPAFMREEEKSGGTARGSAFHRLLELLDIAAYRNYDSAAERKKALQQDIASFVAQGRMSEECGSLIEYPEDGCVSAVRCGRQNGGGAGKRTAV